MSRADVRGLLAVIVVGVAIVVLVFQLDSYGEETESALDATTTTVAPSTTTTIPVPVEPVVALCDRVDALQTEILDRFTTPVLTPIEEVLRVFYTDVSELDLGQVTAEYRAAATFYQRYLEVAGPYAFDPERIVVEAPEPVYLEWRSLVTGDALGIETTNANVEFLCGVEMPEPLTYDIDEIEDLEDDFEREREDFQEDLQG